MVSPIQLATYAATLANNGVRYRTHFVKAILDTNTGEVLSETQPEVMDVIEGNGNTFALVRQGMTLVPSTISGKISSYPIAIACKTGTPQRSEPNEMTLLRLCDVHNIPMATNIATAEVLIHGLERGDLDWRDIVHPQN